MRLIRHYDTLSADSTTVLFDRGIYVERKELTVNKTSDLTKLEIIQRLKELHQETGGVLPVTNYTIEGEKAPDSEPEFENNIREESKNNSSGVN